MAREQIFFHRSGNRLLLCTVGALGSTKGCLSLNPRSVGRGVVRWSKKRKEKEKKKERNRSGSLREMTNVRVVIIGDRKGEDDKKEG